MKHCNCEENKWTDKIVQSYGDITYCPYCGSELAIGYFIKVYECARPKRTKDNSVSYQDKVIVNLTLGNGMCFPTKLERDKYFTKHIEPNLTEQVDPQYDEIEHFVACLGTHTADEKYTVGIYQKSFLRWHGQTVEERRSALPF